MSNARGFIYKKQFIIPYISGSSGWTRVMEATNLSQDVWRDFGFLGNPLDPRPLGISHSDRQLIVGRDDELRQFMVLSSSLQGAIIVEGNIGVGKTSFVNAAQHDLAKRGFLPSHQTIEIGETTEPSDLILSSLSNLVYSLEKTHGANACTKNPSLRDGKQLVTSTMQSDWGGQLSILGTGGGIQRQQTAIAPPAPVLATMTQKLDAWMNAALQKYSCKAGIVLMNNFDRLPEQELVELLNRSRDLVLLRPKILWVLIGKIGMFNTLESQARRVSEIITGQPIVLNPLSLETLHQAIEVRVKKFAAEPRAKLPVDKKFVDMLYEVSGGEIRFIFKRLTDIVYEVTSRLPSVEAIPDDLAMNVLRALAERRLSALPLSKGDQSILRKMVESPFRIRDYARFKLSSQQALWKRVSRLMKMELLQSERKGPREVVYRTVADVNIAYGTS